MQLKIQRSQRVGGVTGKTVYFSLDVRAEYSPEEQDHIQKYRLTGEVLYSSQAARKRLEKAGVNLDRMQSGQWDNQMAGLALGAVSIAMAKMSLNITIGSLGKGHHIECKDLAELLEAEETVRIACRDMTRYLETAATFNGSETVIEYAGGEEMVHITHSAPPLITAPANGSADMPGATAGLAMPSLMHQPPNYEQWLADMWNERWVRRLTYIAAAFLFIIISNQSCS